jgi:class 3 adenylate cyclase
MEPRTERLLLILADISGYTKFMLASQVALVHGQQVITALIEAILAEVAIPLEVKEVEGDAVFLYSVRPRDDEAWQAVSAEVGRKLLRFFEAFSAVLVAESESTLCPCAVCQHMHELKLKIIVHSGEALFHRIGDFAEVSGVDVILAHRLLKNSVDADEYILMTEPAYRDLRFPSELEVHPSSEAYEGFGSIDTFVHYPAGAFEESRRSFFSGDTGQILTTTLGGGLREVRGQFKALRRGKQLAAFRHLPKGERGPIRSILAGLVLLLLTPIQLLLFPPLASVRAVIRRRRRQPT